MAPRGHYRRKKGCFQFLLRSSLKLSRWLGVACLWLWRWTTRVYLCASLPFTTVNGSSPPELQLSTLKAGMSVVPDTKSHSMCRQNQCVKYSAQCLAELNI